MPKATKKRTATPLRIWLWERAVNYGDLSKVTGLSVSKIYRLASGEQDATADERELIARALSEPVERIFGDGRFDNLTDQRRRQVVLAEWVRSGEGGLFLKRLAEVLTA